MATKSCVCSSQLIQPVKIYRISESVDSSGFGQATATDVLFASAMAKVEPQTGREFFRASQVYPTMTHLITIRYRPGLSTTMKVVMKGRDLNIISIVNEEELNRIVRLVCVEVPA